MQAVCNQHRCLLKEGLTIDGHLIRDLLILFIGKVQHKLVVGACHHLRVHAVDFDQVQLLVLSGAELHSSTKVQYLSQLRGFVTEGRV